MRTGLLTFLFLTVLVSNKFDNLFVDARATSINVNDPGGSDLMVHKFETVPNVLGWPTDGDTPIEVISDVPVSVLRYNDDDYLEGGEPIRPGDIYIVVKSSCGEDDGDDQGSAVDVDIQYEESKRVNIEWEDENSYTSRISISTVIKSNNIPSSESMDFLDPSSFFAEFSYTSGWCSGRSGGLAAAGRRERVISVLATIMLSTSLALGVLLDNNGRGRGWRFFVISLFAVIAIITTAAHAASTGDGVVAEGPGRNLQEVDGQQPSCVVNVDILLNGCRRESWRGDGNSTLVDLEVSAPAVRVVDIEISDQKDFDDPKDECTTNYEAMLNFPTTKTNVTTTTSVNETSATPVAVKSIGGFVCARAVEGRPFVDSKGHQLQARLVSSNGESTGKQEKASWSIHSSEVSIDRDQTLGKEWANRALGEHASVPAFAAFTVALMSNGAPPSLVQDSLTAAMDEVRHAKTSFEIASLLLGHAVEPGPLPPSTHHFGSNLTALALATAQEGCIDETLSALVAGYEVDTRIDNNERIGDETKLLLKEKSRTIALEETRHSALAWRTVQWVCSIDEDACSAVKEQIFTPDILDSAFHRRFDVLRKESHSDDASLTIAEQSWKIVHDGLIPFVLSGDHKASMSKGASVQRSLDGTSASESSLSSSFLEEMAQSIIQNTLA